MEENNLVNKVKIDIENKIESFLGNTLDLYKSLYDKENKKIKKIQKIKGVKKIKKNKFKFRKQKGADQKKYIQNY